MNDLENIRAPPLCYVKLCALFQSHTVPGKFGSKSAIFFVLYDLDMWWITLKNQRASLPCYFKFCASFCSHWSYCPETVNAIGEFELELKSVNAQFGSKSAIFLPRVTLKFDGWPRKTKGPLFCATASFVHRFVAICGVKPELQSGNAQTGAKFVLTSVTLTVDLDLVTVDLDRWPWPWLLLMVRTPEIFMMIRGEEHCEKGITGGRTESEVL